MQNSILASSKYTSKKRLGKTQNNQNTLKSMNIIVKSIKCTLLRTINYLTSENMITNKKNIETKTV